MRLLIAVALVALATFSESVDPCKRQPFRGRCPSLNGEAPKRSQFVLRYYLRNGECVSYPYGHCAQDPSEPTLYRYKEECEDACISNAPANLGAPKDVAPEKVKKVEFYSSTTTTTSTTTTEEPAPSSTQQPFEFNSEDLDSVTPTANPRLPFEFTDEPTSTTTTTTTQAPTTTTTTTTEAPTTTTTTELPTTPTTTEHVTTTTTARVEVTTTPTTTTSQVPTTTTEAVTTETTPEVTTTTTTTTEAPTTTTTTTTRAPVTTTTTETVVPTTTGPRTECERRRLSASQSTIQGAFVPVCTFNGDFEKVQCEVNGEQCFCVDSHGIEVPNSRSSGKTRPDCDSIQSTKTVSTKECVGAPLAGPCKQSVSRFFYNDNSQRCEQFSYSGCGGNGNNYESREACEERCAPPPAGLPKCEIGEPLKTKIGVPVNCAKTDCPSGYRCSVVQHSSVCCPDNNKAVGLQTAGRAGSHCSLPKQRGPCDKYELRFYFNADLNECKYFFWGGCEGNANNFERVEDCETACGVSQHSRVTNKPNTEIRTTQGIRITPNGRMNWEEADVTTPIGPEVPTSTLVPPPSSSSPTTNTPTTTATTTRRPTTTRASRVHQTTTPAASEEEEEVSDEEEEQHTIHVQPPVPVQNTVLLGVNRCLHPKDAGTCRGQFVRWFFDAEKKSCDVFTYTGCQGNGNNFASQEECLAICHRPEPVTQQQPQLPDFKQICSNDVDAGECNGVFERFAFDGETGDCRAFTYGGCGGNGNNFATMQECRQRCTKSSTETRVNICESDIDVGECKGTFQRFAFDKSINDCRKFAYGGCGGNGNNFATLQECTNRCINKVCPETPSCDITRCQLVNDRSGCPFCSCPPVKQPLPPAPKCAPIKKSECEEPCIIFSNRKGCEECVCPQDPTNAPSSSVQPPAPSSFQPGPPARPTEAAPPAPSRQFAANTVEQAKPSELPSLPKHLAEQIQEKCLQPVEPGPCKNFADRWYFNVDDGTCHPFKYGGCAGNRNHFFTQKECEVHCARFLGLNDESDESEEEERVEVEEPTHGLRRPVAHGVPIQPTVPLVIPNYSSPMPAIRGGSPPGSEGKIEEDQEEEKEETLERFEAQPPAPATTIVPRLAKVVSAAHKPTHTQRVQGFVVTSTTTTTTTREVPSTTTTTTTTEEPSTTEVELSTEVTTEEPRQPIIKEVVETEAKSQTVNLEKFIPRAKPVPQDFENEIASSGEGSGVEFESEPEQVEEEEEEEEQEVSTTTTTTEAPKLKKVEIRPRGFTTTTTTTSTTSTETATTEISTEAPVTEEVTTESVTETSTEAVTEVSSTTTTTTSAAPVTTTTTTTTTTEAPSTTTTTQTTATVESEFAFNSDEMDENTELVETPDNIRAAGSKTLEAAKAVETKKIEKADNGVSRVVEEIDIDQSPEIVQILSTTSSTPVFEPKFDGRVVCAMPPDAGTCTSYIPRWFFNSQTGQCEQFAYGSCGGNDNNFVDRQTCERRCMPHHVILAQVPDRCSYEKDSGSGKGYNVKWYFNMKNLRCEQFVFEGLGGNSNQFETLSECERICTPASSRASGPLPSEVQQSTPAVVHPEVSEEEYDDDEEPMVIPDNLPPTLQFRENVQLPPLVAAEVVTQTVPLPETTVAATTTTTPRVVVTSTAFAPTVAPTHQPSNRIVPQESLPIVPVLQTVPLPPVPEVTSTTTSTTSTTSTTTTQAPATEPRPPAAHAAKTVFPEEKPTYKAEPVLGREQLPTANDGQPIVGASPKETVNYQTGEVVAKASGIRNFNADETKISANVFNTKSTSGSGLPACANGRQEVTYADGRPVMCLPGKNQCPEKSSCYFNGIDFACCPDEEDPYDKHVFGGYNGEETKNGYKVFGGLNIRRLMDEVPLRQKRQSAFNIDSVVAPLRFDAEKPRQVHRALHMRPQQQQHPVPRHGANPLCVQPVVKGSCGEAHLRYFYDRMSDSCRLFEYSGCDGNANNFGSLEDCQRLCVLDIKTIQNARVPTSTVDPVVSVQEDEKLAPGQCPGGRAPLGGASPVLCGNTTESIGCPTSYYCRRGPPDVCCPGTDPKLLQQPEDIVKDRVRGVVKNESHMPRGFNRQIFLSTPKYMCPDAADPLMLEDGEPMLCGSGFDGVKMCPKGYYCAIDSARSSRLCCPMFGDAQRIASEDIFSQRHAVGTPTTTTAQPAVAEADVVAEAVAEAEEGDEEEEEEEEGEEFLAHLQMKPNKPKDTVEELAKSSPIAADVTSESGVSIDLGADEKPQIDELTTTLPSIVVQDKSSCQIKPSEGRVCGETETSTRTNLQYFYSPKDNRCKLFFYRGCGGNMNRFEKKADCEALCL